jgi:hypothetical protein
VVIFSLPFGILIANMMCLQFQSSAVACAYWLESDVVTCYNEIFKIIFHLILDVIFMLSYAVLSVMGIHCIGGCFHYYKLKLP